MTKRVFRSILLAAMTVLAAVIFPLLWAISAHDTRTQLDQLRIQIALAAHAVSNEGVAYFDRLNLSLDCRITWIAADGQVLYDNRSDSGTMENHLARQEVINALAEGYGESSRYSDTLTEQYIYAAQKLPDGTVLRLSGSRSSVWDVVVGILPSMLLILGAVLILTLWLANRLTRHILQPMNSINLQDPLSNQGYEELRPLLHRLDSQQTQLRSQARELEQKQKEFTTVTYALNEGLVLLSRSGSILSINPAAARLLEVTPNCAGADFSVANRNPQITALTEAALSGIKGEQVIPLISGTYLAVASPVRSEGTISGVVLLLFDVTQKQEAETLRREFTANVSHELKTPLHAISGYAELMKSGLVAPEDLTRFSEKIYSEAQRMTRLVEDTLRLSRLDEGAEEMTWEDTDLYLLAQQTCQKLSAAAELAGVAMILQGSHAALRGVPQLLSAILFNLIDNGVKYNHRGGQVVITVSSTSLGPRLTVADTGMGIPAEHQGRIFERFYRVDKSHSKEVGGTGLGLSIVKHAVQHLNARLDLESTPEKGTTITVQFPNSTTP